MTYGFLALLAVYVMSRKRYTIWRSNGKKYLTRVYIVGRWFRTVFGCRPYLHWFHSSDDAEYHSHRWEWSYGLILWGGYREQRKVNWSDPWGWGYHERTFGPCSINRLDSNCFHRVDLLNEKRGCLTLFLAGPFASEDWGFLRDDGSVEYAGDRFDDRRDSLSDD